MEFTEVLEKRYSCKKYSDQKVSDFQLQDILAAARLAPTAKNNQEQRIYVVRSKDGLAKIDLLTPCRYGAGTVLIVAYDRNNVFTYPGQKYDSGIEDISIVATYMMLAAKNVGVDSCWINFFDPDRVKEEFHLQFNEEVVMMLDLGFAEQGFLPLPNHFSRKEINQFVRFL